MALLQHGYDDSKSATCEAADFDYRRRAPADGNISRRILALYADTGHLSSPILLRTEL